MPRCGVSALAPLVPSAPSFALVLRARGLDERRIGDHEVEMTEGAPASKSAVMLMGSWSPASTRHLASHCGLLHGFRHERLLGFGATPSWWKEADWTPVAPANPR